MEQSVTINNDVCRCCATQGTFKNIRSQYQWMGEEEIYADMIRECFNITLCLSESCLEEGICEVCITQLRNASNFKRQVLQTEEQFKRKIEGVITVEVKLEDESQPDGKFIDSDTELHEAFGDDFLEDDYPLSTIKEESKPKLETKAKKRSAKTVKTKTKKTKTEEGETSTKRKRSSSKKHTRKLRDIPEDTTEMYVDTVAEDTIYDIKETKSRGKNLPEMRKQWHNLTTILKFSNATPFKDRNDAGFVCAYCFQTYTDPRELRIHTSSDHSKEKPNYKAGAGMSSFVAFLDIVDLKCTLCESPMDSINCLTEHLVSFHDKKYHSNITDYFQPFKLTNEQQMRCCLCPELFHNMKLLTQHMNVHYRNFICTTCGAGFVNSFRLIRHETTHGKKKTSFPCKHCGLVFAAESKKKAHVNTEHKGIAGDSVCQICKARFKNYYQKTRHMMQVHNVEGIKCDMCDKKFNLKSNLMLHMRSVHLKERPYECSVCSMGFFIKRHMIGHYMATHTNERKFKCDICQKAYATQNSKRKHMKKNHGISKGGLVQGTPSVVGLSTANG